MPLDACNDVILQPIYNTLITAKDSIAVFAKRLLKDKTEGDHKEVLPLPIFDPLAAMIMSANMKHTSYK